ncbi:MAG: hypothetical protein Q7S09_00340 [bacterium]|nr:hypothetical protein [bacterium]
MLFGIIVSLGSVIGVFTGRQMEALLHEYKLFWVIFPLYAALAFAAIALGMPIDPMRYRWMSFICFLFGSSLISCVARKLFRKLLYNPTS